MKRVFEWSFSNARVRAKIGKLTTSDRFKTIAKDSFNDTIIKLQETPPEGISWPQFFGKKDIKISSSLYKSYEDHLVQVGKYLHGPYRKIFLLSLEETLVNDIKYLIRRITTGHQGPNREPANYTALSNSSLLKDFSSVLTLDELADALEDTPFYKPFNMARQTYEQTGTILSFEVALDLNYHKRLNKAISKLNEPDKSLTGRLFRKLCDIKNLSWILRYRFHYNLSDVEIFNSVLDQNFELSDDKVKELAQLASVADFLPSISTLNSGKFLAAALEEHSTNLTLSNIEDGLAKYKEHVLYQSLMASPFGLAPFMAYQWLKMIELNRFERIITGLQLELPPDTIINSLQLWKEVQVA